MKLKINKIFVGYDSNQDFSTNFNKLKNAPFEVCKNSILRHTQSDVEIIPLKLTDLIKRGLYYRKEDNLATTEFTYSRFLTPYLSNYEGISLFCDSDFLWNCDVQELINYFDESKSVLCVKHDYIPSSHIKMDGKQQTVYPRKNWSSLMLFNCSHRDCRNLNIESINTQTPKYLHRMEWTDDQNIGDLPITYNFLEGDYTKIDNPKVIHYTNGGPWHETWSGDYYDNWTDEYNIIVNK